MVMVKRKKKHVDPLAFPDGTPTNAVTKFLDECRAISSLSRLGTFLVAEHRRVFGTEAPSGMLCLIKAKIAYELQVRGLKSAGKPISDKLLKNYKASQKMDTNLFEGDSKFYMELDKKYEEKEGGENIMAKAKKKAAKAVGKVKAEIKSNGSGVERIKTERPGAVFVELFANNGKAKLSDKQIAAEVVKRCPKAKKYTESEVQGYRNGYNHGKLTGQKGKPGVQSVAYNKE